MCLLLSQKEILVKAVWGLPTFSEFLRPERALLAHAILEGVSGPGDQAEGQLA